MDSSPQYGRSARVGLAYDERMCLHATPDGESHPENPERIRAIWRKLEAEGILERCILLKIKEAENAIIASVHTRNHIKLIRNISTKEFDFGRVRTASKFNSIYFNEGSSEAAYLAAGAVIEATENVVKGNLDSAIAIVRPPGHHAEANEAMGFCLFNNVAIAASYLLNTRVELGIRRILIVDWDVHHGNGTQNMFYSDPRVLYFSVHRFDFGSFYPADGNGSHCMIGEDLGAGYNINVPWEHGQCGDADYLAVWDHILIPVVEAYNPDIILISAGFDAAMGDPLGGCCITPYGYSAMLKKLLKFADGKIVLALEGGYNLNSLANSVFACAKTLLEGSPIVGNLEGRPFESTWRVINEVRNELKTYWPVFSIDLPQEILIANVKPYQTQTGIISSSDSDIEKDLEPSSTISFLTNNEDVDLILPLSKLNLDGGNSGELLSSTSHQNLSISSEACENLKEAATQAHSHFVPWRSSLSKVDVWYGSYGSNMWRPRFLCYIEGGRVESMNRSCRGAMDRTPPKDIAWKSVPHRLFFARSYTSTWGHGAVAFLNPQSSINDKSYMCIYRITLEQFNDILIQENTSIENFESPLLDSHDIEFLVKHKSLSVESIKTGFISSSDSDMEKDLEPSNTISFFTNNEDVDLILPLSKLNLDDRNSGKLPSSTSHLNLSISSEACENLKEVATQARIHFVSWRSSLSKVDVWYGSYGSNMWRPRFLCYIEGGRVESMNRSCRGAMDRTPPAHGNMEGGWYSNALYLGDHDGIPILTMTCSLTDFEKSKSGELPVCAPSKAYENTLLKGLVEGKEVSTEEAISYLKDAVFRKL